MANSRKISAYTSQIHAANRKLEVRDAVILKQLCQTLLKHRSPPQTFLGFYSNGCAYYPVLEKFCGIDAATLSREALQDKLNDLNVELSALVPAVNLNGELAALFVAFFSEYPNAFAAQQASESSVLRQLHEQALTCRKEKRLRALKQLAKRAASQNELISRVARKELIDFADGDVAETKVIVDTFLVLADYEMAHQLKSDKTKSLLRDRFLRVFDSSDTATRVRICQLLGDYFSASDARELTFIRHVLQDTRPGLAAAAFHALCKMIAHAPASAHIDVLRDELQSLVERFSTKTEIIVDVYSSLTQLNDLDEDNRIQVFHLLCERVENEHEHVLLAKRQSMLAFMKCDVCLRAAQSHLLADLSNSSVRPQVSMMAYELLEQIGLSYELNARVFDAILKDQIENSEFINQRLFNLLLKIKLSPEQKNQLFDIFMQRFEKKMAELQHTRSRFFDDDLSDDDLSDDDSASISSRVKTKRIKLPFHSREQQQVETMMDHDLSDCIKALGAFAHTSEQRALVSKCLTDRINSATERATTQGYDHIAEVGYYLSLLITFASSSASVNDAAVDFVVHLLKSEQQRAMQYGLFELLATARFKMNDNQLSDLLSVLYGLFAVESRSMDSSAALKYCLNWLPNIIPESNSQIQNRMIKFVCHAASHPNVDVRYHAYLAIGIIVHDFEHISSTVHDVLLHGIQNESGDNLLACLALVRVIRHDRNDGHIPGLLLKQITGQHDPKVIKAACDGLFAIAVQGSYPAARLMIKVLSYEKLFQQADHIAYLFNYYFDDIFNALQPPQQKALLTKLEVVVECLKPNQTVKRLQQLLEIKLLAHEARLNLPIASCNRHLIQQQPQPL